MNSVYLKYCISFLILITSFSTKAQSVDSLISIANKEITKQKKVDKLNELSIDYKSKNYTVSKELAYQAEKIANVIQYKDGEAIALRNQGVVLTNESKLDEALNLYTKALTLTKNKKIIGQLYGSISRVYTNKSEFVKAFHELPNMPRTEIRGSVEKFDSKRFTQSMIQILSEKWS